MIWNYDQLDKEIEKEEQERQRKNEDRITVDLYTISCEEFYGVY